MLTKKEIRAELRRKSTTSIQAIVQAANTTALERYIRDVAKEVLWERGRQMPEVKEGK